MTPGTETTLHRVELDGEDLRVLEGVGHLPMLEAPEAFVGTLARPRIA
jgi:pimeloyl-ACP methyl ester carboxylesterase